MPRYAALADMVALGMLQGEAKNDHLRTNRPSDLIGADELEPLAPDERPLHWSHEWPPRRNPPGKKVLHYFDAPDLGTAHRYYLKLMADGCPRDINLIGNASNDPVPGAKMWRFRGHSLIQNWIDAYRLGATVAKKQVEQDPQFRNLTGLLNQLSETYWSQQVRKENGVALVPPYQLAQVRGTLAKAETERAKLVVLCTAATDALAGAYRAFGLEPDVPYTTPGLKPDRRPPTAEEFDALLASRDELVRCLSDQEAIVIELSAEIARLKSEADPNHPHKPRPRRGE